MIDYSILTNNLLKDAEITEKLCLHEGWNANQIAETINHGGIYYCATINGNMAGHVGMSAIAGEGYITNIAVRDDYRKMGIGFGLMKQMLDYAKQNNLEFVSLEVRESNLAAINLYKKCGFELVGVRKNFYSNPTENANIMTYYLSR